MLPYAALYAAEPPAAAAAADAVHCQGRHHSQRLICTTSCVRVAQSELLLESLAFSVKDR